MIDTTSPRARRSPTPTRNNADRLKAVRYEDTANGIPPLAVVSLSSSVSSFSARPSSHLPDEPKRDSAFAPSVSVYAESHTSAPIRGSPLPTIVVQPEDDEATPTARAVIERRSHPAMTRPSSAHASRGSRSPSPPPAVMKRSTSFTGLQTTIPEGFMGDFDLEDLRSDKLQFSNRGSIMFGGKKMQGLPAPKSKLDATVQDGAAGEVVNGAPKGLVAGRRKPSVHMLQAAMNGGRVLSTEEVAFSTKVRNMYEFGDENGALSGNGTQDDATTENVQDDTAIGEVNEEREPTTPVSQDDTLDVTQMNDERSSLRPPTANSKRASFLREPLELAGGIEDWDEVDVHDVDRYGFIRPLNSSHSDSRKNAAIPDSPRRDRKLRRRVSRSSRSLPPNASRDSMIRPTASIRSFGSHTPGRNASRVFQSKDQRTLADAGDMLTLPPGLADIAEQEDAGKTASFLKRREWSREEKWQKMARPIATPSGGNVGGGMAFDFDTSDAKLVSRTWKGIPDRWRSTAWHSFLSTSALRRGAQASDEELVQKFHELQEMNSADDVQIDLDVPRTISMHIMFRRRYRGGQRLLFRVLHAVGLYFPSIGYVQGMASLAATLLCYYDEEKAFVMMVRMWQLRGLEQLFEDGFKGLMSALVEFERDWLADGEVATKLEELGITSTAYGTRWYLTLFNMSIPFPAQLRVWDVFMLLGDATPASDAREFGGADLDVLHATSAALVDATREIIMDGDFENAMKVLTSFIPIKDEDLLMRVARTEWKLRKKRVGSKA